MCFERHRRGLRYGQCAVLAYTVPPVNIVDDDYEVPLICKSCCNEVFEEGDKVDISKAYAVIQAKSGRYEN